MQLGGTVQNDDVSEGVLLSKCVLFVDDLVSRSLGEFSKQIEKAFC